MLKHLYKTFVIAILSGSLLTFQTSIAFADSTTMTTDSTGKIKTAAKYDFQKISDTDMLASLGMLAGGFITGRMLAKYKPMTTDVMIAGVGGAAFIAGEILSNIKFKGSIDKMTAEIDKESGAVVNEEQIQRLKDLKKSYEEAKSTTKTKKTLQLASAAAFGAASVTAGYLAFTELAAMRACDASIAAGVKAMVLCPESKNPLTPGLVVECSECATEMGGLASQMKVMEAKRASPGISNVENKAMGPIQKEAIAAASAVCKANIVPSAVTAGAAVTTACTAALNIATLQQVFSYVPIVPVTNIDKILNIRPHYTNYELMQSMDYTNPNVLEKALNFIFPTAQAGWLPLLGLGASTAAAFTLITGSTAVEVDMMMFVPLNRSIAFGALAGVAYLAATSSDNVMGKLDENIKKIDDILTGLNKSALGVKATNVTTPNLTTSLTIPTMSNISLSTDGTSTNCLTSNDSSKCASVTTAMTSSSGFADLPTSLQTLATEAATVGNGLSGTTGISGSTLAAADAFGSKAAAIRKLASTREAAYEKLTGGKVSYEKEKEKFLNGVTAAIKKDLQSKGISAGGMMASLGATPINATEALKEQKLVKGKVGAAGLVNTNASLGKDDLKLDFKEAPAATSLAMETGTHSPAPEYDIKGNDISGEKGPSIFDLISNRYLKSGYPKLLEVEPTKK